MKKNASRIASLAAVALFSFEGATAQQAAKAPASTDPYLLLGTYTNGKSKGIYVYTFNTATGNATEVSHAETSNPSYLSVSPNKKFVYAVNEDNGPGAVTSFAFDHKTGSLTAINQLPSEGESPCYITTSKNGKFIAVANYSSGTYAVFPVDITGHIGAPVEKRADEGKGPNAARQEKAHAHATIFSPDNKFLFVDDLGTDKIMSYHFNDASGQLTPASPPFVSVKPGSGPRHLVFDASAKFAYLITEMSGEVIAFAYHEGNFKAIQTISSHPANYKGEIGSADIHISPDGRFLYASNRGDANSIAIFKRDAASGKLSIVGITSTKGIEPRGFNFDPSGNFLLVAHQTSNDVVIFKVNKETGELTDTGHRISVGSPVCVQWIP
ncbi:6-phosphogluconolactonase [Chitinophaga costaii]|uniref:6-phosphogluconolactonase n=1 Tax=Chitinophaga costaii TaxID=1335309 RepID=A0A1C4EMW0_9BACT|nr:lactonase family protein [Chitinophaga costaii]PUZ22450.1 lactonase family protein [Chitinophaga costaii]SCC44832.1 6-phosphogluconolactonase [Chitinophaga costaii]